MKKTRRNRRKRSLRRTRRRGGALLYKFAPIENTPKNYCPPEIEKLGKESAKALCYGIYPQDSDIERSRLLALESPTDEHIKSFFEKYLKFKKDRSKFSASIKLMSNQFTDAAAAKKAVEAPAAGGRRHKHRKHRKHCTRRK
jgi:hypothetical protein